MNPDLKKILRISLRVLSGGMALIFVGNLLYVIIIDSGETIVSFIVGLLQAIVIALIVSAFIWAWLIPDDELTEEERNTMYTERTTCSFTPLSVDPDKIKNFINKRWNTTK